MGWSLNPLLAPVSCNNHCIIHQEPLAGVQCDAEQARVGIDHPCSIALFEVIQHSRHNEVGHNGCVLKLIEWAPTQNKLFWHQRECFEPLFSPFQVSEGIWLLGQNAPCVGRLVERSLCCTVQLLCGYLKGQISVGSLSLESFHGGWGCFFYTEISGHHLSPHS